MSDAGLLEVMTHDHLLPAPVVPLSEETWHAVLQGLRSMIASLSVSPARNIM
jgi:hypothetical protein